MPWRCLIQSFAHVTTELSKKDENDDLHDWNVQSDNGNWFCGYFILIHADWTDLSNFVQLKKGKCKDNILKST